MDSLQLSAVPSAEKAGEEVPETKSQWFTDKSLPFDSSAPLVGARDQEDQDYSFHLCKDSQAMQYLRQAYWNHYGYQKRIKKVRTRRGRYVSNKKRLHNGVDYLIRRDFARFQLNAGTGIPIVSHHLVEKWIDYYLSTGRVSLIKWFYKSHKFREEMKPIFAEFGLPESLFLIALVESGLQNSARSHASAVGPWQFMKTTAEGFGLEVNYWVDERKNAKKSTRAALKYLVKLYKRFDNWFLAMAAYNAGPGKVNRAIRKSAKQDFWQLANSRWLREETKNYIPKFLAVSSIFENMNHFGFYTSQPQDPELAEVETFHSIKLSDLADKHGLTLADLQKWNPEYSHDLVPVSKGKKQTVLVPVDLRTTVQDRIAHLPVAKYSPISTYKIKQGDTIYGISRRFQVKRSKIKQMNPKLHSKRLKIGRRIVLPIPRVRM